LEQITGLLHQQSAGEMCQIGEMGDKSRVVKRKSSNFFAGWRQEWVHKSFSLQKCSTQTGQETLPEQLSVMREQNF